MTPLLQVLWLVQAAGSDIEWTRWATVVLRGELGHSSESVQIPLIRPPPPAHVGRSNDAPPWMFNDTNRQWLLKELSPDVIDFLDGLEADRGNFFRRYGVAISAGSGFEYDQSFGFMESPDNEFVKHKYSY